MTASPQPGSDREKIKKAPRQRASLYEWTNRVKAVVLLFFPTVLDIPGIGLRECASLDTALDVLTGAVALLGRLAA